MENKPRRYDDTGISRIKHHYWGLTEYLISLIIHNFIQLNTRIFISFFNLKIKKDKHF